MSLREYTHMDAAATRLTQILRKKNIAHMFIGGYAASLIGGERVTEVGVSSQTLLQYGLGI